MKDLLILRAPPYDIMPRKCSGCNHAYLDEPFPAWWRFDHRVYVLWELHQTCGRPGCKVSNVALVPLFTTTPYKRAVASQLSEHHYKATLDNFVHWFLRREDELDGLPAEVQIKCQGKCEGKGKDMVRKPWHLANKMIARARWTIENEPRFVSVQHYCKCASRTTMRVPTWAESFWDLIHDGKALKQDVNVIRGAYLTRLWQEFKTASFDITLYPRLEYAYFGKGLSINARISALVKAQKLIEDDKEKAQKPITHGKITERKRKVDVLAG